LKSVKTYSDHFQKAALALRKQTRTLKEQRESVGTRSDANQRQLDMFQSPRRLLQVRLECLKVAQREKTA